MSNQKGSINVFLAAVILLVAGTLISAQIPINKKISSNPNVKGVFLAKGDDSGKEDAENGQENQQPRTKEKEKVEVKENHISGDFVQNGVKVQFETENGKVQIQAEDKNGKKLESKDTDKAQKEIEQELETEGINIATQGAQVAIAKNNVGAVSNFPVGINVATRQLTVTTPSGVKTVAVLPDQAVTQMLHQGVINSLATATASVGGIPATTKLEDRNGVLVYQIEGLRNKKLLGLFAINTPVTTFVSAENGSLVETQQSLLASILNRLSF